MKKKVEKKFPEYKKSFWDSLGPAVILIGLGIGSGEFILWPYLSANYGFGIMWGALLGITLQLFIILEIQRYTVVRGENIIKGFSRIWKYLPAWVIVSTLIGFGWPGFASISAKLLVDGFGLPQFLFVPLSILVLIMSAIILLSGKNVYKKIVFSQKINIPILFTFIIFLFIYYFDLNQFLDLFKGLGGVGEDYLFLPAALPIGLFLGALAYAGSGGNLLLGNSFYTIEEGQGMTKKTSKFILWKKTKKNNIELKQEGEVIEEIPDNSRESLLNFKKLRKFQIARNISIFWFLGFLTILLLSYISKVTLAGKNLDNDFSFLITEADIFSSDIGIWAGILFLILGIYNLASLQMGILDFTGRSTAYAIKELPFKKKIDHNKIYIYAVIFQVVFGVIVFSLGFTEPKSLIVLSSIINAFVMGLISIFLLILNTKYLPKIYKINKLSYIVLTSASLIYFSLFFYTIVNSLI